MTEQQETHALPGELEMLDPHALSLDGNVRTDAALTKQFVASVRENGVLVPILAIRAVDGTVWVRAGQRRTLAAREAGLSSVPVWVVDAARYDDATDETIERVVTQIVENDHRASLAAGERVRGIQQLLDAGMSVTKTAKVLARAPQVIKDAKAAAGSQAALDALDSGQLTLAQAAVLAAFEDDPAAVERLMKAAAHNYFDHAASQLRVAREQAQARQAAGKAWADKGFAVFEERPTFNTEGAPLHRLRRQDGVYADQSDVEHDPSCWAVWLDEEQSYVDKETGERVEDDEVDWATEDDPDTEPVEGYRHANTVKEVSEWVPSFYCLDAERAGLTVHVYQGAMSESDSESKNVADNAEREKRERRKTLALNKLGIAANEVRHAFVRKLLARKTPPKGAAIFVASTLVGGGHLLTANHAAELAHDLLGASEGKGLMGLVDGLPPTGDGRAQVITLGLVCGAMEAHLSKDAWRNTYYTGTLKPYLEFLVANGYELSPIEKVVTGQAKADKVYDQHVKASPAETD